MKKLNDKSILIIVIIVIIIISMLSLMIFSGLNAKDEKVTTNTTKTTTTKTKRIELKNDIYGISIEYENSNEINDNHKLEVIKIDKHINIENVVLLYDINLKDINNNIVKVNNTSLLITISYENVDNYKNFKVLYLSDNNEVLETLPATYLNNKISFVVNHLSRYAIVGEIEEIQTTNTTTTKKVWSDNTTNTTVSITKAPVTTKKITNKTTTKSTNTKTTKKTTTKKTTTKSTIKTTTTRVIDYASPDTMKIKITLSDGTIDTLVNGKNIYYLPDYLSIKKIEVTGGYGLSFRISNKYIAPDDYASIITKYKNYILSDELKYDSYSKKYDLLYLFYYYPNQIVSSKGNISIFTSSLDIGSSEDYPIYNDWTISENVNKTSKLKIWGKNFGTINCISSNPEIVSISYNNSELIYKTISEGVSTIKCVASTNEKTFINFNINVK